MGKVLENHSKQLLQDNGIPVPRHWTVGSGEEAYDLVAALNKPVVLKSLIPVGKRGKAGGVRFASSPEEAKEAVDHLLRMKVGFFRPEKILVEERLDIEEEWFVSVTIDKRKQTPVVVAATTGGVDVESSVKDHPGKICVTHIDPLEEFMPYQAREIWSRLGLSGDPLLQAAAILHRLYDLFVRFDCYLLEINPLVLTKDGRVVAAACVMGVDDNAMFRQTLLADKVEVGLERFWRPPTSLEKRMLEVNNSDYRGTARYMEMDGGDIGFLCGGGGASLLCFDALVRYGGKPANYTETGGNPPEEKVYALTRGILSKEGVRGLFVAHNITNNTQVDVMARGIVRALRDAGIDPKTFPVVVREAGVNDEEGRRVFAEAGIICYGEDITLEEAARLMVSRMREAEACRF